MPRTGAGPKSGSGQRPQSAAGMRRQRRHPRRTQRQPAKLGTRLIRCFDNARAPRSLATRTDCDTCCRRRTGRRERRRRPRCRSGSSRSWRRRLRQKRRGAQSERCSSLAPIAVPVSIIRRFEAPGCRSCRRSSDRLLHRLLRPAPWAQKAWTERSGTRFRRRRRIS